MLIQVTNLQINKLVYYSLLIYEPNTNIVKL